jgi:hypothetical protein
MEDEGANALQCSGAGFAKLWVLETELARLKKMLEVRRAPPQLPFPHNTPDERRGCLV